MTGRELMERRLYRGQSQADAAAELGMTVEALHRLEQTDGVCPAKAQQVYHPRKLPRGPDSQRER